MSIAVLFLGALAHAAPPPGVFAPVRCGTPQLDGWAAPPWRPLDPPPPPSSEKLARDPYGVTAHELLTDNFVVRWGDEGDITEAEVEDLADGLEQAWLELIELQGHPQPFGTETHLLNVYISDTGGGTPPSLSNGAFGYYHADDEGWPMVVLAPVAFEQPGAAVVTGAHELYHGIQAVTGRYEFASDALWFKEASANWAAATVFPEYPSTNASTAWGYAFLPHYPLNFYNYPERVAAEDLYPYGAHLLVLHLSESTADRALIQEVWTAPDPERDPIGMLQRLLDERGLVFEEAFLDHAAHMATLDVPNSRVYAAWAAEAAEDFPEAPNRIAAEVGPEGTDGLVPGPEALAPHRYGYNSIRIDIGEADQLDVVVEGAEEGTYRNPASWGARLVIEDGEHRSYVDVDFSGTAGSAHLEDLSGETVWLVVAPWTEQYRTYDVETFAYSYSVSLGISEVDDDTAEPEEPDEDDGDDSGTPTDSPTPADGAGEGSDGKGSGCTTAPATGPWALMFGLLALGARSRRPRTA